MATFYVSPTGNDSSDGKTTATAFRTLAQAQQAMRVSTGVDTTIVQGGTYALSAPSTLTAQDSGRQLRRSERAERCD